jgi:membrane-associated phospholipid phosphatase
MRIVPSPSRVAGVLTCSVLLTAAPPLLAQDAIRESSTERSSAEAAVVESAPSPGLAALVTGTVEGFGRLGSKDTVKWLVVGAAFAAAARPFDRSTSNAMSGTDALDAPLDPGQTIGGARFQLAGALATYGVGRMTGSPKLAAVGADLFQAQVISQALTGGLKNAVRRARPDGSQFSFPSGHSSVTFASATVLQRHFGWKTGIAAYGLATYVAASRVQEKRHFLSDVAFGAAIGIVAGRAVTIGSGEHRFAVSPMATEGGGGLSFTWLGRD